jgi:hypothetical protein
VDRVAPQPHTWTVSDRHCRHLPSIALITTVSVALRGGDTPRETVALVIRPACRSTRRNTRSSFSTGVTCQPLNCGSWSVKGISGRTVVVKTDPFAALASQAVRIVGVADVFGESVPDSPHATTLVATTPARTRCRILITVASLSSPKTLRDDARAG